MILEHLRSLLRATGMAGRLSPLMTRLENFVLARHGKIVQRSMSPETSEIVSASGTVIRAGPPRHYADMMLSRHELPTLVACVNVFAPVLKNGVAWDVGGNAGFYSTLLSQLVGHEGSVYAFEPVPATFHGMCANLSAAGACNVTALNLALSDHEGMVPISFDPASDTTSSIENTTGMSCMEVRAATGDGLVASGECLPPTMLKIDIEGHELKALKGLEKQLARAECRAVLCEIHYAILAANGEHQAGAKVRKALTNAGFDRIYFISRSHLIATKNLF
ncbi:MAG TPA: hypothetical protein DIT13_04880 [Verrucomicrobiales bacterium]|nr:hypothetical protein [Verrucomicrobiales bacterium]HRJ08507.1 FkbM family methyltransferase [Prosthecobacter sp.]HRK14172.1 FkbM family methyltransferase [Prosthecobacter sp.]